MKTCFLRDKRLRESSPCLPGCVCVCMCVCVCVWSSEWRVRVCVCVCGHWNGVSVCVCGLGTHGQEAPGAVMKEACITAT